ncbi:AraC family transcriptional regulator [Actinopolymorpha pittospori]
MSTTYAEIAPPAALAEDVRCLWWSSFGGDGTILPDGCLDLVVTPDSAFVAGPDTGPWTSSLPAGLPVHGLRFRTGRAARILGVPASELRDRRVDLADLWGPAGASVAARLAADPSHLTALVAARLARAETDAPDRQVDVAVRRLLTAGPRVTDALSADLGVGERQFRRRFTAAVGYGPATFLRVARLLRVRRLARTAPDLTLADLAARSGYADQSHLARDCNDLAGTPPSRLLRGR